MCVLADRPLSLGLTFEWSSPIILLFSLSLSAHVTTSERRMSQTITWDCNTRDNRQDTGAWSLELGAWRLEAGVLELGVFGKLRRLDIQTKAAIKTGRQCSSNISSIRLHFVANLCKRDREIKRPQGIVKCNCCQ